MYYYQVHMTLEKELSTIQIAKYMYTKISNFVPNFQRYIKTNW